MNLKRKVEIAVISDVHLGTFGCHAKQLLTYLNSIEPKTLILNGDIIDIWELNKRYFPKSHLSVIKKVLDVAANGTRVIYITGNHDELLRKFDNTAIGNISIVNKLKLHLDGKKAWFIHGDVLDYNARTAKWISRLGGFGYNLLIQRNRFINWCLTTSGKERYSLSKHIKYREKLALKFLNDFENVTTDLAIEKGYDYVVCGHSHQPKIVVKETENGKTTYLNSGDWIENFTALEYQFKRWKLYRYSEDKLSPFHADEDLKNMDFKDLITAITIVEQPKKKKTKA